MKGIGNKNSTEVDEWRFEMFVLVLMDVGIIGIFDGILFWLGVLWRVAIILFAGGILQPLLETNRIL